MTQFRVRFQTISFTVLGYGGGWFGIECVETIMPMQILYKMTAQASLIKTDLGSN